MFEHGFCDILIVPGCLFVHHLVYFWCQDMIISKKNEHVIFDKSSTFSHDFQGPPGTENRQFGGILPSQDMPFSEQRFWS